MGVKNLRASTMPGITVRTVPSPTKAVYEKYPHVQDVTEYTGLSVVNQSARLLHIVSPCPCSLTRFVPQFLCFFFHQPTKIATSSIPNAGLGRIVLVDVKKGDIIRVQKIGSKNLESYAGPQDLTERLADPGYGWKWLEDFGHVGPQGKDAPETHGLLVVNNPPLYSNHDTGDKRNIETIWEGDTKYIRALRDIQAGEELFEDYRLFGELPWYEKFLTEHGRVPVRVLGSLVG